MKCRCGKDLIEVTIGNGALYGVCKRCRLDCIYHIKKKNSDRKKVKKVLQGHDIPEKLKEIVLNLDFYIREPQKVDLDIIIIFPMD